jgi:hypothetical protein
MGNLKQLPTLPCIFDQYFTIESPKTFLKNTGHFLRKRPVPIRIIIFGLVSTLGAKQPLAHAVMV